MKHALSKLLAPIIHLDARTILEVLEVPKELGHGDYSFPCFILAKEWKKNPLEIAQEIVKKINLTTEFEKVEAVGAYVNFFLDRPFLAKKTLAWVFKEKDTYGRSTKDKGKTYLLEFSQPNTHKAFHIGHVRGTAFGESLARIKEFSGCNVIRVNYSGDTGMHIAKWLWAYQNFHNREPIPRNERWFAQIYVEAVQKLTDNPKGEEEVAQINRELDTQKNKKLISLWKKTRAQSIRAWKPIYKDLDVAFDSHFFESEVEKPGKAIAKRLLEEKIAVLSDEATIMDFKEEGLGVWILLRRDGTVLYSAKDLALAEIKFKKYKPDESLIITSVEQNLHFKQLQKTLERMRFPHFENYGHLGYESVRLPDGKMSSRTGTNVLYTDFKEELIEEAQKEILLREKISSTQAKKRANSIALSALKYSMLKQDANKVLIFDKEEALKFEGDTGPYLLYTYARAQSILKKARKKPMTIKQVSDSEKALITTIAHFPQIVLEANEHLQPNALAIYAHHLAQLFNEFYHSSKVIGSDEEGFRTALVKASAQTLKNALALLGISVIERM